MLSILHRGSCERYRLATNTQERRWETRIACEASAHSESTHHERPDGRGDRVCADRTVAGVLLPLLDDPNATLELGEHATRQQLPHNAAVQRPRAAV